MKTERKVIAIVSIALGGLGLILSWIPIVNNIAFIFGVLALILAIIALFSNRKNKKLLSLIGLIISVLTLVIVLVTQSIYGKAIDDIGKNNIKTSSSSKSVKVPKHSTSKKKQTTLELLNQLASTSKSTDEIYVTGEITVGDEQTVSPGIYDLALQAVVVISQVAENLSMECLLTGLVVLREMIAVMLHIFVLSFSMETRSILATSLK